LLSGIISQRLEYRNLRCHRDITVEKLYSAGANHDCRATDDRN